MMEFIENKNQKDYFSLQNKIDESKEPTKQLKKDYSQLLLDAMALHNINIKDVSESTGISCSAIYSYVTGPSFPKPIYQRKIDLFLSTLDTNITNISNANETNKIKKSKNIDNILDLLLNNNNLIESNDNDLTRSIFFDQGTGEIIVCMTLAKHNPLYTLYYDQIKNPSLDKS